jgi:hypothetical protein
MNDIPLLLNPAFRLQHLGIQGSVNFQLSVRRSFGEGESAFNSVKGRGSHGALRSQLSELSTFFQLFIYDLDLLVEHLTDKAIDRHTVLPVTNH